MSSILKTKIEIVPATTDKDLMDKFAFDSIFYSIAMLEHLLDLLRNHSTNTHQIVSKQPERQRATEENLIKI